MKILNLFKSQKNRFITKELISLSSLANVPTLDYFKNNNQVLLLINLYKKEYLEILIKEKVLTSNELKSKELHDKLNMLYTLIEQNTLGDELFEKVFFDEVDKVQAFVKLRKFVIYKEQIIELEEEIVSRIIALKEILKKTFLNKQKRISIINEINNLTNIFVILMNQKETLSLCLNNYSLKCFDITKEGDNQKEEELIRKRKEELNAYQMQAFGKIIYQINDLNDMAKVEVALEDYVYNYNWKDSSLRYEIIDLWVAYQFEKFDRPLSNILTLENKCKIFYEFGKNIIAEEDLKKIYLFKFGYFTYWQYEYDVPILIEPFINEKTSKLELEVYEEKVFELINALSNNGSFFGTIKWALGENYFKAIRLLKKELQTDGKYEPKEILKNKYKLNLLIAFSYPVDTTVIKNIYKLIYVKRSDFPDVNFYEPEFTWDEDLPLETINELKLIQKQTKDLGLYLFLKKYYYSSDDLKGIYRLPEGLNKVGYLMGLRADGWLPSDQINEINKFVKTIRQKMNGKTVIFPKTLKGILGDLISDTELEELSLNEGLEYFNFNFTPICNIKKISIPSTTVPLNYGSHQQDNSSLKTICFHNFDESPFYDNIENLKKLLWPYMKISSMELCENNDKVNCQNICELTIDQIIIEFSNIDYPNYIILEKEECKITFNGNSPYKLITIGTYKLTEHINYLIMNQIAKYRGIEIEERKLTKY